MSANFLPSLNDEEEENENEEMINYGREGTIFLIDSRRAMFDEQYFTLTLTCVKSVMQQMIKFNKKTLVGVIFFGTDKKDNSTHRRAVSILQPLSKVKADDIKKLEEIISSYTFQIFSNNFGCSDDASLAEALETCFYVFTNCPIKMGYKRVLLFSNDENPDANYQDKQHQTRKRAEDLSHGGIDLDVIPLGDSFDTTVFYQDMVETVKKQSYTIDGPFSQINDVLTSIYKESSSQRSLGKIRFDLGHGVSIHVSLYKFTAKSPNLRITKLHRETNEQVSQVRQLLHPETCAPLRPYEILKSVDISRKSVSFNDEEWYKIKHAFKQGLVLLGFKPCEKFKIEHQCHPSSFIYPDESTTKGSNALFTALWNRCLAKNVMCVCVLTARQGGRPRYVLLIPQERITEGEAYERLAGGFHVFYLPFAETIGEMPVSENNTTVSPHQLEITKKVIKKLRIKYDPTMLDNPKTSKEWSFIEAMALHHSEPEPFFDSTLPDNESIERALGSLVSEFKDTFNITASEPKSSSSKRYSKEPDGWRRIKKTKGYQSIENLIENKKVDILTIPQLKEHLENVGVTSFKGLKKPDLVNLIYKNSKKIIETKHVLGE